MKTLDVEISKLNLNQFQLARLKLTLWYLVIIFLISVIFSVVIFNLQSDELRHEFGRVIFRDPNLNNPLPFLNPDDIGQSIINASLDRLKWSLFYINLVILGVSAVAGYFLAGRTLRPIKKSMEDQSRFIADASHEMRTPLTALKTSTEVALRGKGLKPSQIKDLLHSQLSKLNDMQKLTESLLVLAKEGHVSNSAQEKISLDVVVGQAEEKLKEDLAQKEIRVERNLGAVKVYGDKRSLTEVLTILLDNAIKYSPKKTKIKIAARKLDHHVEILVKDEGIGISEEDLPRIFDRFYRVDKSRSAEVPGYGLGLSIAKKIIEDHGGTIAVSSQVDKGTSFYIKLSNTGSS